MAKISVIGIIWLHLPRGKLSCNYGLFMFSSVVHQYQYWFNKDIICSRHRLWREINFSWYVPIVYCYKPISPKKQFGRELSHDWEPAAQFLFTCTFHVAQVSSCSMAEVSRVGIWERIREILYHFVRSEHHRVSLLLSSVTQSTHQDQSKFKQRGHGNHLLMGEMVWFWKGVWDRLFVVALFWKRQFTIVSL